MSVWSRYGKDAVIMPSELKGGKTLEEQFANPIARGVITPTKTKEVEQVAKDKTPRRILGDEWVVKLACLYNRTKAGVTTLGRELGISESSAWRLKQKAIEQGLIKEGEPVNAIRDEQKEVNELTKELAKVEVTNPVDQVESEPVEQQEGSVDEIMLDIDSFVKETSELADVASRHQQAALECVKALGVDKSSGVVKVIWLQLVDEFRTLLDLTKEA